METDTLRTPGWTDRTLRSCLNVPLWRSLLAVQQHCSFWGLLWTWRGFLEPVFDSVPIRANVSWKFLSLPLFRDGWLSPAEYITFSLERSPTTDTVDIISAVSNKTFFSERRSCSSSKIYQYWLPSWSLHFTEDVKYKHLFFHIPAKSFLS